jgi:hypothetical protein
LRKALGIDLHLHVEQSRRTGVSFPEPPHTTLHRARFLPALATTRGDLRETIFDALLEAFMHGLFLGLSRGTAAQNEHFRSVRGCDATIQKDKIKRVGRHYMHISHANDAVQQHSDTNKNTGSVALRAIVLKKFPIDSKLRKVG